MSTEVKNMSESLSISAPIVNREIKSETPVHRYFPVKLSPLDMGLKRAMDIVISSAILILLSPIWVLSALMIKLDSRGPVFYRQRRIGYNGRPFTMYKFRSMLHNAEKTTGPVWAKRNDPRITRVGKIVRKLGIDEIPNLFNVLRGDMSLIGPRPERPYFVNQFRHRIQYYSNRLEMRPGITGLAQVYHKYDESIEDVKQKLEFDLSYIRNYSIWTDIKVIFMTAYIIIMGKGRF